MFFISFRSTVDSYRQSRTKIHTHKIWLEQWKTTRNKTDRKSATEQREIEKLNEYPLFNGIAKIQNVAIFHVFIFFFRQNNGDKMRWENNEQTIIIHKTENEDEQNKKSPNYWATHDNHCGLKTDGGRKRTI